MKTKGTKTSADAEAVADKQKISEVEVLKGQIARTLADYDNLRKRTESEKKVWLKFAKQELLVRLLPVLDTIELAQAHLKDKGLEIAIGQFKNIIKEEGIDTVSGEGAFDETVHEAIDLVPGGEKGKIAEVLQAGYKFSDGDVIRPAKVRVHKGEN